MRISGRPIAAKLVELRAELTPGVSMTERTSLGIGGTTDLLVLRKFETIPEIMRVLAADGIPHRFLGGGSNVLVGDGELSWVALHLPTSKPGMSVEGNTANVDAAADLGGMVTFCAKHDLGGMEGLIGVPGSVGGALRMNAGAYGTQIGPFVREVELYRAATGAIETLRGNDIRFDYRHTSFAPDDLMLRVKLELPSKPFRDVLAGIKVCNEKRRSSQPLNQKSAGCIFKNPPGRSAGRMIDELSLKGHHVGDATVSDRHANFFVNVGTASCAEMLALIDDVREKVHAANGIELETEVIIWKN
jgi:UDP-N-acetylmuramate dehydrogenase